MHNLAQCCLDNETVSSSSSSSSLVSSLQGSSSVCQCGDSPWPWWPASWRWAASCSCRGWPPCADTGQVGTTGRCCRSLSSAPSCWCCPTSGESSRPRYSAVLFPPAGIPWWWRSLEKGRGQGQLGRERGVVVILAVLSQATACTATQCSPD